MALTREAQDELNRRADRLSSLLLTVGWGEMEAEVERKVKRLRATAAAVALSPDGADQRKIDTIRGTIAALHWFVGVPRKANMTLERFLLEQGIEMEEEIPVEHE
jgi:hypothetical protein